jgi:hypothetical protein
MAEDAPRPPTSRWTARLGQLGGRTLLVLAVLALAVAAADRSRLFLDWSADRRFSLSPALVALLAAQQEPVELVGIWPAELDGPAQPIADGLRLMAERSRLVTYRHIDPVLHKPTLAEFERRYREASVPAVYVARPAAGRAFRIPLNDGTRRVLQRDVGGALVALADPHPPLVSLLQGHGELRPGGGPEDGAGELVRSLELAGFTVAAVEPARGGRIDASSLLLVAGPVAPLGNDLAAVEAHLADGGAALLLLDDRAPADLVGSLRRRGILGGAGLPAGLGRALESGDLAAALASTAPGLPPTVVVSLRHHAVGQEAAFPHHNLLLDAGLVNPAHPVTARVAGSGQSLLSPWTAPVQVLQPGSFDEATGARLRAAFAALGTMPFAAVALLQTTPGDTWVKQRAEPLQAPPRLQENPPLPLAWASESVQSAESVRDDRGARLVVWGSRQAASDGVLGQRRFANADLLVDAARWLLRRERATAIPEAETTVFRVDASDTTLLVLAALLIAVIPCACIGVAILAWWERR